MKKVEWGREVSDEDQEQVARKAGRGGGRSGWQGLGSFRKEGKGCLQEAVWGVREALGRGFGGAWCSSAVLCLGDLRGVRW